MRVKIKNATIQTCWSCQTCACWVLTRRMVYRNDPEVRTKHAALLFFGTWCHDACGFLVSSKDMCFFSIALCQRVRQYFRLFLRIFLRLQLRWMCFRWGWVVPAEEVGEKNRWRADAFAEHATWFAYCSQNVIFYRLAGIHLVPWAAHG